MRYIAQPDDFSGPGWLPAAEQLQDWEAVFGNRNPLHIEVGCGNGHFLIEAAGAQPQLNYAGIDLRRKRIAKSCRKVNKRGLKNLKFILGDAYKILEEMVADSSVAAFYVNFPDPWPKYRHRRNRLNSERFIRLLTRKLQKEGRLYWVCDHYGQILDVIRLCRELEQQGVLQDRFAPDGFTEQLDDYPPTLYEKKWRSMNRKIFYVCFEKTEENL